MKLRGLCAHTPSRTSAPDALDQLKAFNQIVSSAEGAGIELPIRLLAASSHVMSEPQAYLNAVDPGRMLYGIAARGESPVELRPALKALKTRLISAQSIVTRTPGSEKPVARVGQIPLGTADGLAVMNIRKTLVRGQEARLTGPPAIEHCWLDLSEIPEASLGDEVVIICSQGEKEISVAELYETCRCSPSTLATMIGNRVARTYLMAHEP